MIKAAPVGVLPEHRIRVRFEAGVFERVRIGSSGEIEWFDQEHRHSGIAYLTPRDVHSGRSAETLQRRRR